MMKMTIEVEGMTCDGCARSVRAALRAVDGVGDASANPQTGMTELELTHEVDRKALAEALEGAGFSLR